MFVQLVFYVLGAVLVASAVAVITARNPVHSALFLVLAFFTSAGIWLLLEAEFLAIVLVLVYVGAVMVLFLFVVMMLDVNLAPLREGFIRYLPVGAAVAAVVVVEIALVIGASGFDLGSMPPPPPPRSRVQQYQGAGGAALHGVRLPLRDRGGDPARRHRRGHRADHAAPERGQDPGPSPAGPGAARGPRAPRADADRETRAGLRSMIPLSHFIILGAILFCISMAGIFLNRKNVIVLLMSIELMLLSVNLNFVAFSRFLDDTAGQVFVFFILTVAAAEAAIGLAILVVLFRNRGTINVADLDTAKG